MGRQLDKTINAVELARDEMFDLQAMTLNLVVGKAAAQFAVDLDKMLKDLKDLQATGGRQ